MNTYRPSSRTSELEEPCWGAEVNGVGDGAEDIDEGLKDDCNQMCTHMGDQGFAILSGESLFEGLDFLALERSFCQRIIPNALLRVLRMYRRQRHSFLAFYTGIAA